MNEKLQISPCYGLTESGVILEVDETSSAFALAVFEALRVSPISEVTIRIVTEKEGSCQH